MTKIGSLWLLILFLIPIAQAQVVLKATVQDNEVGIGQPFELVVSVISSKSVDISEPRVPDLDGFILKGQSTSQSSSYKMVPTPSGMDWQSQTQSDFTYILVANKLGSLSLGAFEVVVDGKPQYTQPIQIQVVPSAKKPGRPQRPSMNPFGDEDPFEAMDRQEEEMFNQLLQRRQQLFQQQEPQYKSFPVNPNEAFFIQVEVDKTEVYEGEQVTASWYIYTRGQIESLDRAKFPDLRGFWKEIIEEVPTIQFYEEVVNGIPYRKALLASHALFPLKSGNSVIDEFKIKSKVRLPRGGSYFNWGPSQEYTKSSKPVKIKVLPLPIDGRPASFTGAVGQFQVQMQGQNDQASLNQPYSVKIRFEGHGNAKGIELPAIQWPKEFEVFDTRSESKFFKNGTSYKEFEILVIPRAKGQFTVPSIEFGMFDPQQKKYIVQKSNPLEITVGEGLAGTNGAAVKAPSPTASTEEKTSPGIPQLMTTMEANSGFSALSGTAAGLIFYLFSAVVLLWKAIRDFGFGQRKRNLKDLLAKKLKSVESAVKNNDLRKAGVGMTNVIYFVLSELAEQRDSSREIEKMLLLCPPSLRQEFGSKIVKKFEIFQIFGFAPEEALSVYKKGNLLSQEYNETKELLQKMVSAMALDKEE